MAFAAYRLPYQLPAIASLTRDLLDRCAALRQRGAAPGAEQAAESFVGCDAFDKRHKLALHILVFH
jgi:hypothetical protein